MRLAFLCALAAIVVGQALQLGNGHLREDALAPAVAALAACAVAVATRGEPETERPLLLLAGAGLCLQLYQLLTSAPGSYLRQTALGRLPLWAGVIAAAALSLTALSARPPLGRAQVPALLGVYFLLGAWLIHASPDPRIDVVGFHRQSFEALLAGRNPYELTLADVYGGHAPAWYPPGALQGGRAGPSRALAR